MSNNTENSSNVGPDNSSRNAIIYISMICMGLLMMYQSIFGPAIPEAVVMPSSGVIKVDAFEPVNPNNDRKLIHVYGKAESPVVLKDVDYGITLPKGCLRLLRKVEIYGYVKYPKKVKVHKGSRIFYETQYFDRPGWSDKPIVFKNGQGGTNAAGNLNKEIYKTRYWDSSNVTIGNYEVPMSLVKKLEFKKRVPMNLITKIPENDLCTSAIYLKKQKSNVNTQGDIRVSHYYVTEDTKVTLCGKQIDNSVTRFTTKSGVNILKFVKGSYSPKALVADRKETSRRLSNSTAKGLIGFMLCVTAVALFLHNS